MTYRKVVPVRADALALPAGKTALYFDDGHGARKAKMLSLRDWYDFTRGRPVRLSKRWIMRLS